MALKCTHSMWHRNNCDYEEMFATMRAVYKYAVYLVDSIKNDLI